MTTNTETEINEGLKSAINLLVGAFDADKFGKFKDLLPNEPIDITGSFNAFSYKFKRPYTKYLECLLQNAYPSTKLKYELKTLVMDYDFFKHNFEYWINIREGWACCADKSSYVLRQLINFLINDVEIKHDYENEKAFWIPKTIFKTHDEILGFFNALTSFRFGNPNLYLKYIQTNLLIKSE